jgi:hypothetical protein
MTTTRTRLTSEYGNRIPTVAVVAWALPPTAGAKIIATARVAALFLLACGSSSGGSNPPLRQTGASCVAATQCYPSLDASLGGGSAVCLNKVPGGYCTHTCNTDDDCCAVPGECNDHRPEVCSPFESTGGKYCFLSCEKAVVADAMGANDTDEAADGYCHTYAGASLGCRSTGGGSQNRKVCLP